MHDLPANLNVHFHTLATDGVFMDGEESVAPFVEAAPPTTRDVERLLRSIRRRLGRLFERRGDDEFFDSLADTEPVLAGCAATSMRQVQLFEAPGRPTSRERWTPTPRDASPALSARSGGFSLHAATAVHADDRGGLERLCRYIARPPLPDERLSRQPDGRYRLELKRPWSDGTHTFVFEPLDLIARLVGFIPAPQRRLLRYHGVYAPNAKRRSAVTPVRDGEPARTEAPVTKPGARGSRRVLLWAELMRRVFAVDPLDCPHCGSRLRLIALIERPDAVRRILKHLGHRTTPRSTAPARAPPEPVWQELGA